MPSRPRRILAATALAPLALFAHAPGALAAPGAFSKISPANGAVGVSTTPTATWGASSGASYYSVCANTTATCATGWVVVGNVTSVTWPGGALTPGTTYYWQVRAVNGGGTTYADGGAWWSFTTRFEPPSEFGKATPANGAADQSKTPQLRWSASVRAASYEYCLDATDDGSCGTAWIGTGLRTFASPAGLGLGTTYYWQVRAVGAGGETLADFGAWWSFTTRAPEPRDALAPPPSVRNPPDLSYIGVTPRSFGYQVAAAGDVNGDGFADLVVGAPGMTSMTTSTRGSAFVYAGGVGGLGAAQSAAWIGASDTEMFGWSVAAAGDVNGDGYGDVIVGAFASNNYVGRAELHLGSAAGAVAAPALTLTGVTADFLGYSVASAGDVNGDGYGDILVGAPGHATAPLGHAYVHLGGAAGPAQTPDVALAADGAYSNFGASVASAGDVNGDGYDDVLVGEDGWDSGRGRVHLHLGGPAGLSPVAAAVLTGEAERDYFGVSVASAGDVNGDGYDDVLVGATIFYNPQSVGRAYLYLGGPGGPSAVPAAVWVGEAASDRFGLSVASAGDVNGDGYADVAIGALGYASETGRVYVYLGGPNGPGTWPAHVLDGGTPSERFGVSVAGAGDVNGDGFADLIVGAYTYGGYHGRAYLYFGGNGGRSAQSDFTGDLTSDILWRHTSGGDMWLWPMAGGAKAGDAYVGVVADANWEIRSQADFDGDGTADLLWRHRLDGTIYLWRMGGGALLEDTYVATVDLSFDIAGACDFDGDGKADILWRDPVSGVVWLWRMDGPTVLGQYFVAAVDPRYEVEGLGDLNGDAKADVVWIGPDADVWVWLMNGPVRLEQSYVATVLDKRYRIEQVADFFGFGKAGLLWRHTDRGELWVWQMSGTALVSHHHVGTVGDTNYRIQAAGDYNGDGKADILWRNIVAGDLWVWLMNGPVKASEAYLGVVADQGYQIVR